MHMHEIIGHAASWPSVEAMSEMGAVGHLWAQHLGTNLQSHFRRRLAEKRRPGAADAQYGEDALL